MSSLSTVTALKFAHPSEEFFARVLDHFGIEYDYEKYTFIIQRNEEGLIARAFTPDFYIPVANIFVELTSMDSGKANRKRRKIEKVKEIYNIDVMLMCKKDLAKFAEDYDYIISEKSS